MAKIKITVFSEINQPPNNIGSVNATTNYGQNYVFSENDFLTNTLFGEYHDPENDPPLKIKILNPWSVGGSLKYDQVNVFTDQEISIEDINNGLLIFFPDLSQTNQIRYEGSAFQVADTGSEQYSSLAAKIYITVLAQ